EPSPEASKNILLRRVSLDLTGLPAPENIARQFLQDNSPEAYPRLVDSLLATPAFGERWAAVWLDLARYSDTKGYESDYRRNVWRYRDWVIQTFNSGMPYDQFLTQQMAGDLLAAKLPPTSPEAENRWLATTYHRLSSTNDEGGTDNEEFRTAAVIDRVATTWQGLLGTSFACAQCHGHPYDPIRHEEYYQFLAFFNNTRDEDLPEEYPLLRHFSEAELERLKGLQTWVSGQVSPEKAQEIATFVRTWQPSINTLSADSMQNADLYGAFMGLRHEGSARLRHVNLTGKNELLFRFYSNHKGGRLQVRLDRADGQLLFEKTFAQAVDKWRIESLNFKEVAGVHDLFFSYSNPKIKLADVGVLVDWLRFQKPFPGKSKPGYEAQHAAFQELVAAEVKTTPILFENPPDQRRTTRIFDRGNWLTPTDTVSPGTPGLFSPLKSASPDRLVLANWLVSKDNPLTARTLVNRLWAELFGQGIAPTLEDLGSQGIPPTHPELLDWLAWRFMNDHKWNFKAMLRELVLSATYRQDSKATPELLAADPQNQWLARGSRVRLSAEQVRDQALAVSGILSKKMYGEPVMPFQPEGIWKSPYNGDVWKLSEGEDRHRRSVYTFWKRSSPYPSAMIFDAADRNVCSARRVRTNTPLQALVTLNDEVFFEAACHLGAWMKQQKGNAAAQISAGYERVIGQAASQEKLAVFEKLHQAALAEFQSEKASAGDFLRLLEGTKDAETAALSVVGNAMLNLDEFVMKN
ncbi:MAG: DUF1553 domain-containing protein, partial [Bacteroidota bacterium]